MGKWYRRPLPTFRFASVIFSVPEPKYYRQWVDDISCSVAAVAHYHAVNEPVCMYGPGTSERAELDAALKRFNSEVQDVPVVVGDEEIHCGEPLLQPKVSALYFSSDISMSD